MRQAFGGLLWSKQFYYYDVARWLDGDPAQPAPPASRRSGRNAHWRNFNAFDIMSMPDKWEYPWFAAWDLAFHCVSLAHHHRLISGRLAGRELSVELICLGLASRHHLAELGR